MSWKLSAFADEAGRDVDTQVRALKEAGLSYVDLRGVGSHTITELPVEAAREAAAKLKEAGITVAMYGSPIGKIDIADDFDIDRQRLEHLARMAEVFECRAVRMFSYYNKGGESKDTWRTESLKRLEELCSRAESLGLVLYHENESNIYGDMPEDVLDLSQLCDQGTFRLIYDFANYMRTGVPGWECWQMLRDKTEAFHVKDQTKAGHNVPIGQGDSDAERIIADAVSSGWNGPCTVEPHLVHSDAVLATHVTGKESAAYRELGAWECFQLACRETKSLFDKLGAAYE